MLTNVTDSRTETVDQRYHSTGSAPVTLPSGLHVSSAIFQTVIDMVIHGLNKVLAYLKDVSIFRPIVGKRDSRLKLVLNRLIQDDEFSKSCWYKFRCP